MIPAKSKIGDAWHLYTYNQELHFLSPINKDFETRSRSQHPPNQSLNLMISTMHFCIKRHSSA